MILSCLEKSNLILSYLLCLSICVVCCLHFCVIAYTPKLVRTLLFLKKTDFFPTCQVRVVRFYQSCSSPPRLALLLLLFLLLLFLLLLLLLLLLRLFRLDHVCINFHLNFRLANSSPSSLPTSQLNVHRWTSTWDLPSSVCIAGPQPGTFPAQWAPLDLNWDLPSSVCTAGHQPGTFPAQCALLDLNLGPAQLSVHRWTSTAR